MRFGICVNLFVLAFSSVLLADDFSASNFAELFQANEEAVDGDVLHLVDSDYVFTSHLVVDKSLIIQSDVPLVMFTSGDYHLYIQSQVGGTTQTWVGPIKITKPKNLSNVMITAPNGDLNLSMSGIETENSKNHGFILDANSLYDITAYFNNCVSNNNNNEGFATYSRGTGSATLTLENCSASGNHVGADVNNPNSTMTVIGGSWLDNDLRAFVALPDSTMYLEGVINANNPIGFANRSKGHVKNCVFGITNSSATASLNLFIPDILIQDTIFNFSSDVLDGRILIDIRSQVVLDNIEIGILN